MVTPAATTPVPPKWSWKVFGIWCVVVSCLYLVLVLSIERGRPEPMPGDQILFSLVSAPFAAAFYYAIYIWIKQRTYRLAISQVKAETLTERAEVLQEDLDKDFFTNLVRINFKYLDKYYLQTQEQADKSFLLCLMSSLVGLLIIVAGVTLMYLDKTNPAYVTTAAGVASEFVAAIFFYLYNKTILSMSDYHKKLVITQNISLALKITDDLPEQARAQSQIALIEALTKDVNHLLSGSTGTSAA